MQGVDGDILSAAKWRYDYDLVGSAEEENLMAWTGHKMRGGATREELMA
jgi:hypothetical protein